MKVFSILKLCATLAFKVKGCPNFNLWGATAFIFIKYFCAKQFVPTTINNTSKAKMNFNFIEQTYNKKSLNIKC